MEKNVKTAIISIAVFIMETKQKQTAFLLKKIPATISFLLLFSFLFSALFNGQWSINKVQAADTSSLQDDYAAFQNYSLYKKYEKKKKYDKYQKYKRNKEKYGFKDAKEKADYKDKYTKYRLYKKNPTQYRQYAIYEAEYKKYSKYKKYVTPYSKYSKYSKFKKYDKSKYEHYKNYGTAENKAGYDRYVAAQAAVAAQIGEADLGGGTTGPNITVGLIGYTKSDLTDSFFRIKANKDYNIKDNNGTVIAQIPAATYTKVKYISGTTLQAYESLTATNFTNIVSFDAVDTNNSDLIFDINNPGSAYDQYRGTIKLSFYDAASSSDDRIWVINTLPLEQYIWGMGEITGTGDTDHNRTMVTAFRTYGYWKIKFSTKYAAQGFKVTATTSSQLYYGYDWEAAHLNIKTAAEDTQGKIVMYLNGDGLNEIALTPYSSWTDGRTRSFEERWGTTAYPWCRSVDDSYGKHTTKSTTTLEAEGNHMVGLSANGSLNLATNYSWDWDEILNYYFYNINIHQAY